MKLKDLQKIIEFAQNYYINTPQEIVKIDGLNRPVTSGELLAISYYAAVLNYLQYSGVLTETEHLDIIHLDRDSDPEDEDYL